MTRKNTQAFLLLVLLLIISSLSSGCSFGAWSKDVGYDVEEEEQTTRDDAEPSDGAILNGDEPGSYPGPPCESGKMCRTAGDCGRLDIFCDGEESCDLTYPDPVTGEGCCVVTPACPEPADPCMGYACIEETQVCVSGPLDGDGDGSPAAFVTDGEGTEKACEGGSDCDDDDESIHPGAEEACDEVDNDCDGLADESGWTAVREPEIVSTPGARATDAAIAALEDSLIVAWSESGESASPLNVGMYSSTPPVRHAVAGVASAGEVEIIAAPTGDIFVFWVEEGMTIKGLEIAFDGTFQDQGSPMVVYDGSATGETISDLEAAARADTGAAALFFRSQKEGNFEIFMTAVSLTAFGAGDIAAPVRITRATGFSGYPSAAAGTGAFGLAWEDERDNNKEIYFTTISSADGTVENPARLTAGPGDSRLPSVAATPGGFAVVWMDESAGPFNLFCIRVSSSGLPVSYPAGMNGPSQPRFYPSASSDPRGPDHADQVLVVYVLDDGSERSLYLTAADGSTTEFQEGMRIYSTSSNILGPSIAGSLSSKGVIWIEWTYDESILKFLSLECSR
jgi:hypothetical protein